jgi:hypothetical protein
MSSKDELKRAVCEAIDRHADTIIDLGETILRNPETGFNEVKTAALVAQQMSALGLEPRTGLALTGVKGRLAAAPPGRGSLSSASSTACVPRSIRSPIPRPGRRTAAATTPRLPGCWGRRSASAT